MSLTSPCHEVKLAATFKAMTERVLSPVVMVTDGALPQGSLLKFDQPQGLLVALRPEEVPLCLQEADAALAHGYHYNPPSFRGCSTNTKRAKTPKHSSFPRQSLRSLGSISTFTGYYTFCGSRDPIDLDAMLANLTLEEGEHSLSQLWIRSELGPKMSLEIA